MVNFGGPALQRQALNIVSEARRVAEIAERGRAGVDDVIIFLLLEEGRALTKLFKGVEVTMATLAEAIEVELVSIADDVDRFGDHDGTDALSRALNRAGASALHENPTVPVIDDVMLFLSCLMEPACRARVVMTSLGVSPRRMALRAAHNIDREPPHEVSGTTAAQVVLRNDDLTRFDVVIAALVDVLGV